MFLPVHCPHEPFGRTDAVVHEMIAGVPLQRVRNIGSREELLLTADGGADGGEEGRLGMDFTVTETEIETRGFRRVLFRIVQPVFEPYRRRGGDDAVEQLGLVSRPQCEESGQRISAEDKAFRKSLPLGGVVVGHGVGKGLGLGTGFLYPFQSLSCSVSERRLSENGRCRPRREFVKPACDRYGDEAEGFVTVPADIVELRIKFLYVVTVDGLQKEIFRLLSPLKADTVPAKDRLLIFF